MNEHETMAKTYLKFVFQPKYAGKLERETTVEIFKWLEDKGYIIQSVIQVPDSWWEEILRGKDATTD